jgi:D-lactate dehydrogenase (cytochrome)
MDLTETRAQRLTDATAVAKYTSDESSAFHGFADEVVLPRTLDEMRLALREAASGGTSVSLSAAGTSITGSRVPYGGMVLGVERMRDYRALGMTPPAGWSEERGPDYRLAVSPDGTHAIVPAGVRLTEVDLALAPRGLLYPPDPTEMTAMLAGTIATNASGARSYRFGATRAWIDALLVVSAAGEAGWIERGRYRARDGVLPLPDMFPGDPLTIPSGVTPPPTKNAAGLDLRSDVDLVDLLVGSEGILAAVAGARIRLVARPDPTLQLAAFFATPDTAFAAADAVRSDPDILAIEYFDSRALSFIRHDYPETPHAGACVLFEQRYRRAGRHNPYPTAQHLQRWQDLLAAAGSTCEWLVVGEELRAMKSFRHALPEQVNRWVASRVGKLGTDMAVPAERFAHMCEAYADARTAGVDSVLFGHLGQYHLHLNFLPEDEGELREARVHYRRLAEKAVELGGTVSAEHGVGKKQLEDANGNPRPYLAFMYGDAGMRAIRAVKRRLDPGWLLNPGTMVPRP